MDALRARMLFMSVQRRRDRPLQHEREQDEEEKPAGKRMPHAHMLGEAY
jgi:hypothetical protein